MNRRRNRTNTTKDCAPTIEGINIYAVKNINDSFARVTLKNPQISISTLDEIKKWRIGWTRGRTLRI